MGRSDAVQVVTYGETKRVPVAEARAELRALGNDLERCTSMTRRALRSRVSRSAACACTSRSRMVLRSSTMKGAMVGAPERLDPPDRA